jgi:hypothetical protein
MRVPGLIGTMISGEPIFFITQGVSSPSIRSLGRPIEFEFNVLNPNLMAPRRPALILW